MLFQTPKMYAKTINFPLNAVPSTPPMNISGSALNSTTISLLWHPPKPEDHNGIIKYYIIVVDGKESGERLILTSNSTTVMVDALHPFYLYNFVIAAVTIGPGPYSDIYSLMTLEDGTFMYYPQFVYLQNQWYEYTNI